MRIIEPSYEILTKIDGPEFCRVIEKAGRTCYKSEDKMNDESASKFVKMIVKRDHLAMIEHAPVVTVKFIANRGFTHEMVRHRIASFAQESTRYCDYSNDKFRGHITLLMPEYLKNLTGYEQDLIKHSWKVSCETYQELLKLKVAPQAARDVLPIGLKAEIIVTANLRSWKNIFHLRCDPAAHPIMHEVMRPLEKEFHKLLPEIF